MVAVWSVDSSKLSVPENVPLMVTPTLWVPGGNCMMRQFVGWQIVPWAASAGLVVRKFDCAKAGSEIRQSRSSFFMLMVFQSCRVGRTEDTMPNKPFLW